MSFKSQSLFWRGRRTVALGLGAFSKSPAWAQAKSRTMRVRHARPRRDEDVVIIAESFASERVPCEVCGAQVAFEEFVAHASLHESHESHESQLKRASSDQEIPCDVCGELVSFRNFAAHARGHSKSEDAKSACGVCGALMALQDLEDHQAAHRIHQELLDAEFESSTSAVNVTARIVEMARKGGSGLPGNRSSVTQGDQVLARWSDGHWYAGRVLHTLPGKHHIGWDPPYDWWGSEDIAASAVLPRMNQPREVCNFDVALAFVERLSSGREEDIEIIFHWTREENVNKIIENNLRAPGERNADGTAVTMLNGKAFGQGIYAATNINFGRSFGCGNPCAFLCLAASGRTQKCRKHAVQLASGHDCLKHDQLRVYRSSEQLLPLFFTDDSHARNLAQCAQDIADVVIQFICGPAEASSRKRRR